MIALFLLIAFRPADSWWGVFGFIMLYVAAILTIWSMVIYISIAWPQLMKKGQEPLKNISLICWLYRKFR